MKKLAVNPWTHKVNLNFYADGNLTPRGKKEIDEMGKRGLQRIQEEKNRLSK